jgi:hypothetical protein
MSKKKPIPKNKNVAPGKPKIRNYDDFVKLIEAGTITGDMSVGQIDPEFEVGWLQLLAWSARYARSQELTDRA